LESIGEVVKVLVEVDAIRVEITEARNDDLAVRAQLHTEVSLNSHDLKKVGQIDGTVVVLVIY